jgi:hypothetical protein
MTEDGFSIVGDYYTKFEPFSREKKVARVDFLGLQTDLQRK